MTQHTAVIQNGQLVLEPPLSLPEGTRVQLTVEPLPAETEEDDPLLWLAKNSIPSGISDMAEQHDHYLYGVPKRLPQSE
jgi:hypothetical protein